MGTGLKSILHPITSLKVGGVTWQSKNFITLFGTRYDIADGANIASQEASTTAASAHAKGSYFILNGYLYKATTDIAIGDTITVDANCSFVKVGTEIEAIADSVAAIVPTKQTYANVYNPNDPDIVTGKYIHGDNNLTTGDFNVSGYIPCNAGGTFIFPAYTHKFGTGSSLTGISTYDASKNFIARVYATYSSSMLTLTFPSNSTAKFFRVNVYKFDTLTQEIITPFHTNSNFMVIKGDAFPTRFYPYAPQYTVNADIYSGHENLSNPLYGKKAVFMGDSICEGGTSGGWAKRIGANNTMLWQNQGISGATISTKQPSKVICTQTIQITAPDYIIFDGGTNDADLIGSVIGGSTPEGFGEVDDAEWGTDEAETYYGFDISTFCGAFEYFCKRLIKTYPSAKIGYIVAQKMGVGTTDYTKEGNNRRAYFEQAMKICEKWGIPYINLWNGCYLNPHIPELYTVDDTTKFYSDGQHLLAKGYDYISPMIEAWMKTL